MQGFRPYPKGEGREQAMETLAKEPHAQEVQVTTPMPSPERAPPPRCRADAMLHTPEKRVHSDSSHVSGETGTTPTSCLPSCACASTLAEC